MAKVPAAEQQFWVSTHGETWLDDFGPTWMKLVSIQLKLSLKVAGLCLIQVSTDADCAGQRANVLYHQTKPIRIESTMKPRPLTERDLKVPGRVMINRKQLLCKVPMSDRTIFEMEKRGEFPQRFSITPRMVGWDLQEVDDWIARQHQAAVPQPAPGQRSREPVL